MIWQKTLKNTIRATGIGMYSGEKVIVTLRPAPANSGIVDQVAPKKFIRILEDTVYTDGAGSSAGPQSRQHSVRR